MSVTYADIEAAAHRLKDLAHQTPVVTSRQVDARTGARVFFKCENLQRIGAFKFRGAYNTLSQLTPDQLLRGVLAYSSGNHAQAVALAASLLGSRATIVMPDDAPVVKVDATRGYGAEVVLYDKHKVVREELADRIAKERGLALIPPFNHPQIVAGQGTAGKELLEETGPLDYLFVPVGGGGLISGCAIAAHALAPDIQVVGVEPLAGDDATRSFHSRSLQTCHNPDTIADGARTASLGSVTFPLVMQWVQDMMALDDRKLASAMFYLWERLKLVVEPTGALGAAGVLEGKHDLRGKRVGVILSGGNVNLKALSALL
jgi:threonine dehydratase